MRTFLVFILILTVLLVACTSEPAPPPPQASNDATMQAPANAAMTERPSTETPTSATPPLQTVSTDTLEPTAAAPPEPTPATEPNPTAPPTPKTATPTPIAEPPTLTATPTSRPAQPTATATTSNPTTVLRVMVSAIPSNLPDYDRHDWKHWTDADGDCQDARQEVLVAESRTEPSFRTDRKCRVTSGEWLAPYTGTVVTDPSNLDIDHMVPLGNAHASGASNWSANQRERYANHLDDPQHLIAVTASANRSKGARGPEDWKPDTRAYWCQYATDWITIKEAWALTVTQAEHDALAQMLDTCATRPTLLVERARETTAPAATSTPVRPAATPVPPTATLTERTYSSCDVAQAAGQPRVQGSKGDGRGFPKWMVPGARDGDGDGVVCEQ